MALSKYFGRSNSFGTSYVDSLFKKQYEFTPGNIKADTMERLMNAYAQKQKNSYTSQSSIPKERSFLDRSFDLLLTGNYVSANIADSLINGKGDIGEAIVDGFKAGNPFGKGFEQGETTYSNVMENMGWKPEGLGGKIAKGTVGFVFDVLLDPTTYMTFGIGAALKGTGRVGTAAKALEELATSNPQFAEGIRQAGKLTDELANKIVESANAGKKSSPEQLASEAVELKNTYNKLLGVDRAGQGISVGLKNMPFGDKLARKIGVKGDPITLVSDKSIRSLSDTIGMSRGYQATRNAIYGSRIGNHLSKNAGLKRLAEMNPAKLYEYIGAVNTISGKNLDKLARDKEIREIGTKIMGLNPSEHKKIIEALETPTIWNKVTDTIKFGDSTKAKQMAEAYTKEAGRINEDIVDMRSLRDDYTNASEADLADYRMQIAELRKTSDLMESQKNVLDDIDAEIADLQLKKPVRDTDVDLQTLEKELSDTNLRYKQMYEAEGETVAVSKFNDMEPDAVATHFDTLLKSTDESLHAQSVEKGSERYASKLDVERTTRELREDVSEMLFGNKHTLPIKTDQTVLKEIATLISNSNKGADDIDEAIQSIRKLITKGDIDDFVYSVSDNGVHTALRNYIEKNPDSLVDDMRDAYSYLANKYGYSDVGSLRENIVKLQNQMRKDPASRKGVVREQYDELADKLARRNAELAKIKELSPEELRKYIEVEKEAVLRDELYDLLYADVHNKEVLSDGINSLSEKKSSGVNPYDKEDPTIVGKTIEEAEFDSFKVNTREKPYTLEEARTASSDDVLSFLMKNRQKALFERMATPQALQGASEALKLRKQVKQQRQLFDEARTALKTAPDAKAVAHVADLENNLMRLESEYVAMADTLRNSTNYSKAFADSKNINGKALEVLEAQQEVMVQLANKLYPHHTFSQLTKGQKRFINGSAYYAVKGIQESGGNVKSIDVLQDTINEIVEKQVAKKASEQATERISQMKESILAEQVDVGTGVRLEIDGEVVSGTVMSKVEEKVTKSRTEMNYELVQGESVIEQVIYKKGEKDPVTGRILKKDTPFNKTKRSPATKKEVPNKIEWTEGTGAYKYTAQLTDGRTIDVTPDMVKGTYVDEFNYETITLPAFSKAQLDDTLAEVKAIKSQIRKAKKIEKLSAPIEKALDDLVTKREAEAGKLSELFENGKAMRDSIQELKQSASTLAKTSDTIDAQITKLVQDREAILKALDDTDAFELMVKRDLGEGAFAKLQDEINFSESSRLGIDDVPADKYSDTVKFYAKQLRTHFTKAGVDEVAVGKLDEGAFEEMMNRYFPRTLSEDGRKFFDENPTLAEKYSKVTSDYGFGTQWNPYIKGRGADTKTKTLAEVNDFFQSEHGVRIFEENVGQAYLNRMLTHSDSVYDERAMVDLMYRFGHELSTDGIFSGVKKGYTPVANYSELKTNVRSVVKELAKEDVASLIKRKSGMAQDDFLRELDAIYDGYATKLIGDLGLDKAVLKGETTPLIHLTDEQIKAFEKNGMGSILRQVNTQTVDKANQTKKLIMERDEKALLKVYDKFMTFFKLNQTTILPSFHIRNKMGNIFQGYLGVGSDVFNPKFHFDATKASLVIDDMQKLRALRPVTPNNPGGKVYHWDEIVDLATTNGLIDKGFFQKDFAGHSFTEGTRVIPGKFDPFNTNEFFAYKVGGKIGTTIDNSDRLMQFASLLRQGKSPTEASDQVVKYLFDYGDLTDFEKRVMKRIFPYYTWMRKNTPLMGRELIEQPEKFARVAKIESGIEGMNNEEDMMDPSFISDFARDWVQTPLSLTNKFEGKDPVLFSPNLPYADLKQIPLGQNSGDVTRGLFAQTAPMLKLPIELATNWNSFFDAPIADGTNGELSPRLLHVMSQLGAFNAAKQFVQADGADNKILALTNTFLGQKMTAYNIEASKERIMEEVYNSHYEQGLQQVIGNGVMGFAKGVVSSTKANLSNISMQLVGSPYSAFDENGPMMPISVDKFNSLSDAEKKKYEISEDERMYFNAKAKEMERKAYEEAGVVKKFMWMLIDEPHQQEVVANVYRVVDGDTFEASVGDKTFNVRMLMIDTPESVGDYKDNPEPYGKEASERFNELILGKDAKVYIDGVDTYGRATAYIEVNGKDPAKTMLDDGLAQTKYTDMANGDYTTRLEEYYNSQEQARKLKKGMWSE